MGHSDGAIKAVADAHSADGFFEFAAFFEVILYGFGGAPVAEGAVVFAVGGAEIAEVADSISLFVGGDFAECAFDLGDFEGESGGRSRGVGMDAHVAGFDVVDDLLFESGFDTALIAEGEGSTDLDATGSGFERFIEFFGLTVGSRKPEGDAEFGDLGEINFVFGAVNGFIVFVQNHGSAWRGVVSSGEREFNDKSVDGRGAFLDHLQGEDVATDDCKEFGSLEFADAPFGDGFGVKSVIKGFVVGIIIHVDAVFGLLNFRQRIERGGDLTGDSSTHEDEINFGEHGSEERSEVGDLNFFEEIDADGGGVIAFGEPDFYEIGNDGEFKPCFSGFVVGKRTGEEGFAGIAVSAEVFVPDPFGHILQRKCGESVFEFAGGITHLESA